VKVIVGLINPPTKANCASAGILEGSSGTATSTGKASSAGASAGSAAAAKAPQGLLARLDAKVFGSAAPTVAHTSSTDVPRGGG